MTSSSIQIQSFNLRAASDHEYQALNAFANSMRAERLPDDPPLPLEETIQDGQNLPGFVDVCGWAAWSEDHSALLASAFTFIRRTEDNQHLVWFELSVLPAFRQQGLGRRLLASVVEVARREQRRLLFTETHERAPAGARFMQSLGAQQGLVAHTNQLVLADLDRTLLRQWQADGAERASGFDLNFWRGAYPEAQLEAIVQLWAVMNTAPRDQLAIEDFHQTPARLRQIEQYLAAIGTQRWTIYATERATGAFAGYTEVLWNSNRPTILEQGATGVFPAYRNRGLGRWLKAAMLEKVLQERPQVKFVRTGNADSNAAMLKINHALGFKPYLASCFWHVETERAAAYLAGC